MSPKAKLEIADLIRHSPSDAVALTWLDHAMDIAAKYEREACAQLTEGAIQSWDEPGRHVEVTGVGAVRDAVSAIRARGRAQ